MGRAFKRQQAKEERRQERSKDQRMADREDLIRTRRRTPPGEFLKEVRQELKKVAWPGRHEITNYTLVVIVATAVLMSLVFVMDFAFGRLVFSLFGG